MPRKLIDGKRSRAIVSDAWDHAKAAGNMPTWPYMGAVQIVDSLLVQRPELDGRDLSDALILCSKLGIPATRVNIVENLNRVHKGRTGVAEYR